MRLAKERTIMTSGLTPGDVVGRTFNGGNALLPLRVDTVSGDNIFTNLFTGGVLRDNTEREYYYFPDACLDPLGK